MTRIPTHRLSPATSTTSATDADEDWRHQAACREVDPETFFPESRGLGEAHQAADAKAVCARCPVRPTCLQGALERRDTWGVWRGELFLAGVIVPQKRRRPPAPTTRDGDAA